MISLTKLRKILSLRMRTSGEDFDYLFYAAVNDVISDIIVETVFDVDAIDEDDPGTEIDLAAKYFNVFLTGVSYFLSKSPAYSRQTDELNDGEYRRALAKMQGEAMEDEETPVGQDYEIEDE